MNRYGKIRFAKVPERVSTKSFVVLLIGKSKSSHLGAQDTIDGEGVLGKEGVLRGGGGGGGVLGGGVQGGGVGGGGGGV